VADLAADVMDGPALAAWIGELHRRVTSEKEALTELDAAIGDGDHGANLARGFGAVVAAVGDGEGQEPAALLKQVGMTLVSKVGGASGPLYGTLFLRMAGSAGDGPLDAAAFAAALRAGVRGVEERGKAAPGDKTMLDALLPACDALEAAVAGGSSLSDGLAAAAEAARTGRDATAPMVARKGRASYLGERSAGHLDPGATSSVLLVEAAAAVAGRAG
jgi:phosphoenolpyruvate---glycerone phosphotransferase subunit DhaL